VNALLVVKLGHDTDVKAFKVLRTKPFVVTRLGSDTVVNNCVDEIFIPPSMVANNGILMEFVAPGPVIVIAPVLKVPLTDLINTRVSAGNDIVVSNEFVVNVNPPALVNNGRVTLCKLLLTIENSPTHDIRAGRVRLVTEELSTGCV
jgi:hypothetical protein